MVVYERAGRYYIDEVQWRRNHRRHYRRDYDGWSDDDKRQDDDKRNDDHKDGSKGNTGRHLGHGQDDKKGGEGGEGGSR